MDQNDPNDPKTFTISSSTASVACGLVPVLVAVCAPVLGYRTSVVLSSIHTTTDCLVQESRRRFEGTKNLMRNETTAQSLVSRQHSLLACYRLHTSIHKSPLKGRQFKFYRCQCECAAATPGGSESASQGCLEKLQQREPVVIELAVLVRVPCFASRTG